MTLIADPRPRGRPFPKGVSGNPAGRPSGVRNRRTLALEGLLDAMGEALLSKLVERALEGDVSALRACMKIIFPRGRKSRIEFPLPPLETVGGCLKAQSMIIAATSTGELPLEDGDAMLRLVDAHRRSLACAQDEASLSES